MFFNCDIDIHIILRRQARAELLKCLLVLSHIIKRRVGAFSEY